MKRLTIILAFLLGFSQLSAQEKDHFEYHSNGKVKLKGALNKKGRKEGTWISFDKNGKDTISLYTYHNGKLNGAFIEYKSGTNFRAKFETSQLNNYSDPREETFKITGFYKDELLHGIRVIYFQNGQVYQKGSFEEGSKMGEHLKYHDNGNLALIEHYKKDVLHGAWQQFYNTGKLREERVYEDGLKLSVVLVEWYDNGNMKNSTSYIIVEDEKVNHGKTLRYYENGKLQLSSVYEEGKPNGKWEGFYENGNRQYIILYEDFVYKSYTKFDENGIETE